MSRPSTDSAISDVTGHFEGDTVVLPIADDQVKDASPERGSARAAWSLTSDALPAMRDAEVPKKSRASGLKTVGDLPSLNADSSATASQSKGSAPAAASRPRCLRAFRSSSTARASGRTNGTPGKEPDFNERVCATLPRVQGHVIRPQRACSSTPCSRMEAWGEATMSAVPTSEELPPADKVKEDWRRTFGKFGVSKAPEMLPLDEPLMPRRPAVPNRYPAPPFRRLVSNHDETQDSDSSDESADETGSRSGSPIGGGNADIRTREIPPELLAMGRAPRNMPTIANLRRPA